MTRSVLVTPIVHRTLLTGRTPRTLCSAAPQSPYPPAPAFCRKEIPAFSGEASRKLTVGSVKNFASSKRSAFGKVQEPDGNFSFAATAGSTFRQNAPLKTRPSKRNTARRLSLCCKGRDGGPHQNASCFCSYKDNVSPPHRQTISP